MKKIIATIVALVFSTSAYAVTISDLSVGASINHGIYGGNGKEENYTHTGTLETTTKKDGAAFVDTYATVFLELALNENVSLGVSYAPDSVDTPQNINSGEGGDNQTDIKVSAEFEDLTTVYLLAKSDIGVFAKAGYSQMDINVTSENAGTYNDTDTDGLEFAIGYERDLGEIGVRAELAYHSFDDVKADNGQTDKNEITVSNMEGATARISLVKSF
jgi:hypothetical protein